VILMKVIKEWRCGDGGIVVISYQNRLN